jgi:hypothetical protein
VREVMHALEAAFFGVPKRLTNRQAAIHGDGSHSELGCGGDLSFFSTSDLEAFVGALRRSSTTSSLQVVRPRRRRRSRRCWFLAGVEAVASSDPLFYFGVHRLEVAGEHGGGDPEAPDCFSFFSARVFFVRLEALSSNSRFLRASVVKGLYANLYPPRVINAAS